MAILKQQKNDFGCERLWRRCCKISNGKTGFNSIEACSYGRVSKKNIGVVKSQKDMLQELLLPFEEYQRLADFCKEIRIQFLSTPFDIDSISVERQILVPRDCAVASK